jgi:hypothetical protein
MKLGNRGCVAVELLYIFSMSESEQEEPQQIGRLADEYARLKNEVQSVEERVKRVHRAYLVAAISFEEIAVNGEQLSLAGSDESVNYSSSNLQNLLSTQELVQLFHERGRLHKDLDEVRSKLRGWLTHV